MDLMGRKSEQVKFKMLAIPWFRLNFKLFYNREKEPRSGCRKIWQTMFAKLVLPPCAPADLSAQRKVVICRDLAANISSIGFIYGSKKLDTKDFKLQ